MLKDLWHFAQEYEVDGLKERTLEELREWADPGYSNWDYVSNNVQAISAPDVPAQLYQEMVKVWAEYSIKKSRVYEGKLMDAAYRVERFGVAVQEEIAQMGGSSSKTMC